ncbi:MAG: hypothetical protein LUE27_04360 [Clostridia bacterium]|nr:hypothetical protein [Clostridia bacterium]
MSSMEEKVVGMETLVPDNANANRGTLMGKGLLQKSFMEHGAGRSILIDKNDRIVAGNKSQAAAERAGITKVRVVEADRDEIVAVRRTDMDLDTKEGREMAALDNTTTVRNLEWDETALMYIAAKWGADAKEFGVAVKDWEDTYKPVLNPQQQNEATTEEDVERAQEKMDDVIERHKESRDTRRVKCPNSGYEFDIQKYDD